MEPILGMARIIVTGGTGMIGKSLHSLYGETNFIYLGGKDCDLCDYNATLNKFLEINPTHVIHLAANVGGFNRDMSKKVDMLYTNSLINLNVIKASYEVGVKRMVCCSSLYAFPEKKPSCLVNEDILHMGPPPEYYDTYAYAKRVMHLACDAYNSQYGTEYINIIPSNIYGKHDNFNIEYGRVIPSFIHQAYLSQTNKTKWSVNMDKDLILGQFIHCDDVAQLCVWTLFHYKDIKPLIITSMQLYSVDDIVRELCSLMNINYYEMVVYKTDTKVAKKSTDYILCNFNFVRHYRQAKHKAFEFASLRNGLKDVLAWFIENYDNLRK